MKQAMIFAAGLGTRLKPLTDTMPKAMVRVGGEPLLKHVIVRLRDAGFTRLVVNVHHFASQITTYLRDENNFGMDIQISDESAELLDTGGGIRHAQSLFDASLPVLIHNVDILSNVDLARFYTIQDSDEATLGAKLLVSWRKTKRYLLFDDAMRLVGWVNVETGQVKSPHAEVRHFVSSLTFPIAVTDSPMLLGERYRMFAFSGIHLFMPRLFPLMEDCEDKFPIMDFYLTHCHQTDIVGVVQDDLRLMDVGKSDTLHEAEAFISTLKNQQENNNNN